MTCTYCGLQTDGGRNHGTAEACVQALEAETQRLRDGVQQSMGPQTSSESNVWRVGAFTAITAPPQQRLRLR
jgi:hypothetical protein